MPKNGYNPFDINPSDSSKNFVEEQDFKRKRKAFLLSKRRRNRSGSGKITIDFDTFLRDFLNEYADDTLSVYSDIVRYLLTPIAQAYYECRKQEDADDFRVEITYKIRRDDYGNFDKEYDLGFFIVRAKVLLEPVDGVSAEGNEQGIGDRNADPSCQGTDHEGLGPAESEGEDPNGSD
jgi:hypothetical protein